MNIFAPLATFSSQEFSWRTLNQALSPLSSVGLFILTDDIRPVVSITFIRHNISLDTGALWTYPISLKSNVDLSDRYMIAI